jgi:DUF4097 and DUF4098 domain-containing protein YvlB
MNTYFKFLTAVALTVLIALPAVAGSSGSYSTVNKSIQIGDSTTTGAVDSVNGSIRIGSNSFVNSVDSVNGSIKLANDVTVETSVDAVNGAIALEPGCEVGGDVGTINGSIRLETTTVAGNVETVNGQLRILSGSEVSGNVVVRKSKGWSMNKWRKPVRVEIGQDVVVHGDLIFEHPVELKLHDSARIGEIIGEEVTVVGSS